MNTTFRLSRCGAAFLAVALGWIGATPGFSQVTLSPQEQGIANHLTSDPGQERPFLKLDPILTKVARAQAQDMADHGYFGDTTPQGYGPDYLVQQAGYQLPAGWTNPVTLNYIESIAAGESSADATWNDWMNSSGHKEHLLGENAAYQQETSYGVGFVDAPGSKYTYYWVVITAPPAPAIPAIAITSPAANAKIAAAQVSITGTTSGNGTVASVQFRVENSSGDGAYQTASGTTNWSGVATGLVPGANTIRAQSLGSNNSLLAQTTQTVIYAVPTPLTVSIAGSGSGSVTAGFLGTTQRDEGLRYTITATPAAGSLFQGWTGSVTSTHAAITFTMASGFMLTANFIPNPFTTRKGTYSGLLQGSEAGLVKVSIGGKGAFTASVHLGGHTYSTEGQLAADGTATIVIKRHGQSSLTVTLALDVNGTTGLAGALSDGTTTEDFADTQSYQTAAGRFAQAGRYTVSLPPNPQNTDPNVPLGNGWGTLNLNGAGHATLSGSLADGHTFLAGATVTGTGQLTFYVALYGALGVISGQVTLEDSPGISDLDGTFRWIKPTRPQDRIAPLAFDTTVPAVGSLYNAHGPVLTVTTETDNSQLQLGAGNLETQVVQTGTLDADHVSFTNPALKGLNVKLNPLTGHFAGSFVHPVTGALSPIHGVIFQKQNAAFGYFLGENTSGYASLSAAQ
jgi:Divergent InlB B-repeat domain/Cysteine-rich secretory protein family/Bacterial Ig domain